MIRIFHKTLALLFLAAPLFAGECLAGSPAQDFNDEKLLATSVTDIGKMEREEIETFISFLGTCDASESSELELAVVFCARERELFMLKYSRGRALDRLIRVHTFTWKYISLRDRTAKPGSPEKAEVGSMIERYVDISGKLSSAATSRFQLLTKVQ